jgi:hypothetical protein
MPIGTINMAVAELDIHIESTAVATMNPSTRRSERTPTTRTIVRAIRRWRSRRSNPSARRKPRKRRNTTGSAYGVVAPRASTTQVVGQRTIGRRLVVGIGIASLTHHVAIQSVLASAAVTVKAMSNGRNRRIPPNSTGPRMSPTP